MLKPRPNSLNLHHLKQGQRPRLQNHNNNYNYQEEAAHRRRSAESDLNTAAATSANMGYVIEPRFNPVTTDSPQHRGGGNSFQRRPPQSPAWTPTDMSGQTPTDPKTATTATTSSGDIQGDYGVDGATNQSTLLNYESVVVLNNNNTYPSSTIRSPLDHQMTVTSIDSTTPMGKLRKMKKDAKRLVFKDGSCNVSHCNIQERRRKYLADLFTTLIDIRWRWSFFIFFASFVCR